MTIQTHPPELREAAKRAIDNGDLGVLLDYYLASLLRDMADSRDDKETLRAKVLYDAAREFGETVQTIAGK